MGAEYKLTYFNIEGLGQSIRYAFILGKMEFEDNRIEFADWAKLKESGKCPFEQLPILEADGEVMSQSNAILTYIGKLTELYPTDAKKAFKVDEFIGGLCDIRAKVGATMYEKDEEKKKKLREELATTHLPKHLKMLDSYIEKNGKEGYIVGDKFTIAELALVPFLGWLMGGILDGIPKTCVDEFKQLIKVKENLESHEDIKAFREKHKKPE